MSYKMFLNHVQFPVPPSRVTLYRKSAKIVEQAVDGTVNITYGPMQPREYTIEIRLPGIRRKRMDLCRVENNKGPEFYIKMFEELEHTKEPVWLDVYRSRPDGVQMHQTNVQVQVVSYFCDEDAAKIGFDTWVKLMLMEYPPSVHRQTDEELKAPPQYHTVRKGDTLWKLAARYYGDSESYTQIMEANNLCDPNAIKIGQRLVI